MNLVSMVLDCLSLKYGVELMKYRNSSMTELLDLARDKTLICFGAGQQLELACEGFADASFFEKIDLIADNSKEKQVFYFDGREKLVYQINACLKLAEKEPLILVTMLDCMDVIKQLDSIPELDNCNCYIFTFVRDFIDPYKLPVNRVEREPIKIPKIIHYCWFGGKPIREDFKAYIETWKKYCPDYEIVCWNESNYDYKQNDYMYEAHRQKKWGFVPDYARLDIIYRYGGVYMDTDVELVRNIDDLLCDNAFCGFESRHYVANGLGFGAVVGFPIIKEQMKIYDEISFVNSDGSLNLTSGPWYQTRTFRELGLKLNNALQEIQGMKVYPSDVLSPMNLSTGQIVKTDNTYAIHHYSATWFDDIQRKKMEMLRKRLVCLTDIFHKG